MSGGVAHVLDEDGKFAAERCNHEMVDLESFADPGADPAEEALVRGLIERHAMLTGSARARMIVENWNRYRARFVKVMPLEYRKVLAAAAATARSAPAAHA
jgi:glutamate synthase domain-containing protein 3